MGKSLKGKELGTGITQRKDGIYQARFTNRFGKRETIYAKTYTEVTRKLRQEQYNDENKLNVAKSDITLDEWFDVWMDTYKKHCRVTTRNNYLWNYKRISKDLGWKKLSDLSQIDIQNVLNNLKSDASRKTSKAVLCDMLNKAIESDLIIKNNASRTNAKIDNYDKKEKRILSNEEVDILYAYTDGTYIGNIIKTGLETGMRIGEITGLTWDCIDWDSNLIHVRKTLCYSKTNGKKKFFFNPPKSSAGYRSIPMSVKVKEVVLRQMERTRELSECYEPLADFENLVFPNSNNHPAFRNNIAVSLDHLTERINKDGIEFEPFTPHSLRHTFATNCIAKGMNPKVLQKILGHSTLQMTMDLYCHVREDSVYNEMAAVMEMV